PDSGGTCEDVANIAPVGMVGDVGRFGHADLAGNLSEWVMDLWVSPLDASCADCARISPAPPLPFPTRRGGAYLSDGTNLLSSFRVDGASKQNYLGIRCARIP